MALTVHRAGALDALPKFVVFDLDDTLYDYARAHDPALAAAQQKFSSLLSISDKLFHAKFAEARAKVKQRLGHTASSHSRLLYFQLMLEELGLGTQPLLSLDLEQTYWRTFLSAASLFPAAEDVLTEFQARGVRLALVTDLTSQIQFRKIVHFGLDRYFDVVVTSEEAGQDKIGLEPFRLARAKLGLSEHNVVWAIGDAVADLAGAREVLGAVTIQKRSRRSERFAADASFAEFADLLAHIRRIADLDQPVDRRIRA